MRILVLYHFSPHTTANYLARAFRALGHDVRTAGAVADLSAWANPYRLAGPHDWPLADGQVLDMGDWRPDLAVWVESGVLQGGVLEGLDCQVVGWFIDTHNPGKLAWHKQIAPAFDHVFCAMLPALQELPGATWLPLACDPEIHTPRKMPVEPEYDLAWVGGNYRGHPLYARRFEAMRVLQGRYRCNFASGVYFEDMADVYASARIGWHMSVTGADLDMRPFEIMCSGRPLVTDTATASGLAQLEWGASGFERDTGAPLSMPIWTYDDEAEMFAEIEWLLNAGQQMRDDIGADARAAVLAHHTYAHRARQLIEVCGG